MAAKRVLAATVAAGALLSAAPAIAQVVNYEHIHPANEGPIVFESAPMVQALPGAAPVAPQVIERRVEVVPAPPPPPPHEHGARDGHEHLHGQYYPIPAYPGHPGYAAAAPQFDRSAWLAECRDRIRGVDRDSDSYDECADSLDRYMADGYGGHGYGYPGYGYGYAYPAFAYVPVLVQVPQRTIVHETITEEWVTVPGPSRTVAPTKIIRHAPAPSKRTKLIKGR